MLSMPFAHFLQWRKMTEKPIGKFENLLTFKIQLH